MTTIIHEYDAKVDSKRRVTLRTRSYEYYHVEEHDDGRIVLEPRELTRPINLSKDTLRMMDVSVSNLKKGRVSKAIKLPKIED